MSLQVWLPLNGTLENKGLDNTTINQVGSSLTYSDGKIGQALIFPNNPANYVYFTGLQLQIFTWTLWFKCTGTGASSMQWIMSEGRDYSTNNAHGTYIRINQAGTSLSMSSHEVTSNGITIELNRWYHAAMTADGTNMKFYLNGELKQTLAYTMDANYTESAGVCTLGKMSYGYTSTTNYFPFNGQINDVRIYDNALSETEIKEIAKGLVLHLQLNNNGLGNENYWGNGRPEFFPNLNSLEEMQQGFGFARTSSSYLTYSVVPNEYAEIKFLSTRTQVEDGRCQISKYQRYNNASYPTLHDMMPILEQFTEGEHYTLSYDLYITSPIRLSAFISKTSNGVVAGIKPPVLEIYTLNKWIKVQFNYQIPSDFDKNNLNLTSTDYLLLALSFRDMVGITSTGEVTIRVKNIKFEKGDKATPWCPSPVDAIYPASGSGIPENLLAGTDLLTTPTSTGTNWEVPLRLYNGSVGLHTFTTENGIRTDTIALAAGTNSNLGIAFERLASEIRLDPNEYYTLSCEAKASNTNLKLSIGRSYYNDQSTWQWRGGENLKTFTTADTWQKITHTFKPDANTYAICYCFTVNPKDMTTDQTWSIRKCKLEKGSVATEWQPSPVDTTYKTLGYYNNISFDQSGYNYNAIKYGDIHTYTSDSKKYNVSTHFSNKNQYIKISGLTTTGFGNSYSIAWWGKMDNLNYMQWGFMDGIRVNGMYTGRLWNTGDSSNNPLYIPGTTTQVTAPTANVWHHYVMTGNGTKCYVYVDGLLFGLAKTYKAISGTTIIINGWDEATRNYTSSNYSVSDFRLYATALSAQDVKSLYNNNAYIDSNNNIHGKIRD